MKRLLRHIIFLIVLISAGVSTASAQTRVRGLENMRAWQEDQKILFEDVVQFSAKESIRQTIDAGFGKRNLAVETTFSGTPGDTGVSRKLTSVRVNGVALEPDQAQEIFRRIRAMFRPEIVHVMDSYVFPIDYFGIFEPIGPPEIVERDSVRYWKIDALGPPPPRAGSEQERREPAFRSRPGMMGRMPGRRNGMRQNGPPNSGQRTDSNFRRVQPDPFRGNARPPRPIEITGLFDFETYHLRMTRLILPLPGRARLVIRTRYRSIEGLDVPVERTIEGTIPTRRRDRVIAVSVRQRIVYSDYRFERHQ
jgi:hypothetical protein